MEVIFLKGCLLIHGFTGAPFEVEPLAQYLETLGFHTLCPILPGHGGTRKDLRKASYVDWLQSVDEAYIQLSQICDEIAVLGFSMGGLLAFNLTKHRNLKCLVTMGTPIYCFDIKNLYMDIKGHLKKRNLSRIFQYANSCFTPISANINFRQILRKSRSLIRESHVPIFVVHGKLDPVAHRNSAQFIYDKVQSQDKKIKLYDDWGHRFKYSHNPDVIYKDIGNFIEKHLVH